MSLILTFGLRLEIDFNVSHSDSVLPFNFPQRVHIISGPTASIVIQLIE